MNRLSFLGPIEVVEGLRRIKLGLVEVDPLRRVLERF
jgi:hypothetical protein